MIEPIILSIIHTKAFLLYGLIGTTGSIFGMVQNYRIKGSLF